MVDSEPSDSSSDSDDGVPELIEVFSNSDAKESEFEPVVEVEPEMDNVVRDRLILKTRGRLA
jgi:hypothetical protein